MLECRFNSIKQHTTAATLLIHPLWPLTRAVQFRCVDGLLLSGRGWLTAGVRLRFCREDRQSEAAQYDFFPVTYLLPMEYGVFVEDFKRQADKPIWIAKPIGKAQVTSTVQISMKMMWKWLPTFAQLRCRGGASPSSRICACS